MKILIVHNDYAKRSGEEAVVEKMDAIFRSLGYNVAQLRMTTAGLRDNLKGKVKGFLAGIYSPAGVKAMAETLDREKPDLVNVHNLYPFISPAALRECKKRDIPVVMTIHNYRLMCPTGLFMRDNRPCELCLQNGNEWGCVKYNCEHSTLKSIGYAARNAVARIRRHYLDCVDFFACLTEFQRSKLIQAGFAPEKLVVIPNSVEPQQSTDAGNPDVTIDKPLSEFHKNKSGYVAFAGRLSPEKGIDLILETARRHPEIPFKFAGAKSPLIDDEILKLENVELLGHLSGDDLENFYRNAAFFVMASKWYEGFPMTVLETARYAKPMVAPNHGGFPEIIEGIGLLFEPGNVDDLENQILRLWNNRELTASLGKAAMAKLNARYVTPVVAEQWRQLIEKALHRTPPALCT